MRGIPLGLIPILIVALIFGVLRFFKTKHNLDGEKLTGSVLTYLLGSIPFILILLVIARYFSVWPFRQISN